MTLLHGSLFSGYGGLDLAVEATLDARTIWHCEIDRAASLVLAHRWPGVPNLGDITAVDWDEVPPVDILSGGSPCQGLSLAGRRAGLADPRSGLWSYFAEAVNRLRPTYVLFENVRGVLSTRAGEPIPEDDEEVGTPDGAEALRRVGRGELEDGDGQPPRALGVILGELADIGYDSTWCGLPASAVGLPHPRFRVFLLATPADADQLDLRDEPEPVAGCGGAAVAVLAGAAPADPESIGRGEGWPGATERREGRRDPAQPGADAAHPEGERRPRVESGPERPGGPAAGRGGGDAAAYADDPGREWEGLAARPEEERREAGEAPAGRDGHAAAVADAAEPGRSAGLGDAERADGSGSTGAGPAEPGGLDLAATDSDNPEPLGEPPEQPRATAPAGAGGSGVDWGIWAPAVERWEHLSGVPAPHPVERGPKGGWRLAPELSEWMMGLPPGWITDVPGIARPAPPAGPDYDCPDHDRPAPKCCTDAARREAALRMAGSGVVPQQAAAAIPWLFAVHFGQEDAA